jgi:hypothetical protein
VCVCERNEKKQTQSLLRIASHSLTHTLSLSLSFVQFFKSPDVKAFALLRLMLSIGCETAIW